MWQLILGPLFGIIGGGLEKFTEYKTKQLDIKEKALDRQHDLDVMNLEANLVDKRIKVEGEIAINTIDAESFKESYRMGTDTLLPKDVDLTEKQVSRILFVELFCRIIRPASTTLYQIFIAIIFGWSAMNIADNGANFFTGTEFQTMFKELVYSVIGLAETTLLWWYGIRRMSKKK